MMNCQFSNISILTFRSFYPDTTKSITQVLPPGIFKHIGSLDPNLNTIALVWIRVAIIIINTYVFEITIGSVFQDYKLMSYWDIESFLAEEQPATFRFVEDAEGMAFLDASKGITGTVPADSPLNTPIWIISTLRDYVFKTESQLVRAQVPKFLQKDQNEGYYKSLQNDRSAKLQSINLRQKSPYYFQIYEGLHKVLENNKNLMQAELIKTIIMGRGAGIIDRASMHQQQTKAEAKFNNYVECQRELFRSIRKKSLEYEKWQCRRRQ